MPTTPPAQIILSTSRAHGLVAIPYGEEHRRAVRALGEAGFRRIPSGAFATPLTDGPTARQTARALVHCAHEHGATITTSPRPYLADFGDDLVARLPGAWSAQLELYYNPLVQQDLIAPLWDSGDLLQALLHDAVPGAVVLKNGVGTELLLIERPGHSSGYLLGAFATEEFDDNWEAPNAPRSIVLPAEPGLAAHAVTTTFLPAYSRALHHRRLDTVLTALERIRAEHETLQAIKESGRYSDGVPLADARMVPEMEATFADYAWLSFRDVLEHAPVLLSRCRPAMTPWAQDAAALDRLRTALAESQAVRAEDKELRGVLFSVDGWKQARSRFGLAALPAIETWLAESEAFERQVRAAVPGGPVALAAPTPRLLTARPALPAVPRSSAAHR
ncbi:MULTISPECIES: hypothetical protein [unclassified Streptomyces]|uniref:hypothetical protein n=1 Tax=unclassified Streptomyces TaxID=2593676 RepID=UPI000823897E|nr:MULTISPECIES: hypothetical protein [unclassified Streptomyces]MYT96613.1 hypothetical protein [Streptomyces sp. SID8350]SCK54242.1 hypothetical protein YUWDRAFT_04819 [Streptomyces sp. AmelKG-D3]